MVGIRTRPQSRPIRGMQAGVLTIAPPLFLAAHSPLVYKADDPCIKEHWVSQKSSQGTGECTVHVQILATACQSLLLATKLEIILDNSLVLYWHSCMN